MRRLRPKAADNSRLLLFKRRYEALVTLTGPWHVVRHAQSLGLWYFHRLNCRRSDYTHWSVEKFFVGFETYYFEGIDVSYSYKNIDELAITSLSASPR